MKLLVERTHYPEKGSVWLTPQAIRHWARRRVGLQSPARDHIGTVRRNQSPERFCRATAGELADKFGVKTCFEKVDVTDADNVDRAVASTVEALGRIDILVNNAGVTRDNLMMRMKPEDWDFVHEYFPRE